VLQWATKNLLLHHGHRHVTLVSLPFTSPIRTLADWTSLWWEALSPALCETNFIGGTALSPACVFCTFALCVLVWVMRILGCF
jgi:hypothetical protein